MGDTGGVAGRARGIDRVLALFAYLNRCGRPVRLADLPKALGAPRSTTYEIVRMLTAAGLLEVSGADNKVYFGRMMYLYGISYFRDNDLIRRGTAEVEALSALTGKSANCACSTATGRRLSTLIRVHGQCGSARRSGLRFPSRGQPPAVCCYRIAVPRKFVN